MINKSVIEQKYQSSYKYCYQANQNSDIFFLFKKYFIRNAKQYICIILVNINNIYAKYSYCGPIHFHCFDTIQNIFQTLKLTKIL